jgi:hypothetical protein
MRYGIVFANVMQLGTAEGARAIGSAAEETGFDSVWTVEHVVVPKGYQSEYPYSPNGKMPEGFHENVISKIASTAPTGRSRVTRGGVTVECASTCPSGDEMLPPGRTRVRPRGQCT